MAAPGARREFLAVKASQNEADFTSDRLRDGWVVPP